ncbi:MAG: hypothetical protein JNM29_13650, partial [Candidatus Odyssella sp.]|nr:hypothetical protein [Candidatus Odyssella sp.]
KATAIITAVTKDNSLDKTKLAQLFDKTSLKDSKAVRARYETVPDLATFRLRLNGGFPIVIDELFDALQK